MLPNAPLERPIDLPNWMLLLSGVLFLIGLSAFPIYIVDEARNAQAAWEMYAAGEWIVPTFNGGLRTDKPPLHYYGMMVGYLVFGKTALAARLGSAVCGLLTVGTLYYFTRRAYDQHTGLLAGLVYVLGFYVPLQFHLATPDSYLTAAFTFSMLALQRGYADNKRSWLYLGYFALGLATLAKGPVAPVLAGLSWTLYLLTDRRHFWRNFLRLKPFAGFLILVATAFPWYVAAHYATDGLFTEGFFWEHNLRRFAETKEGHGGSPLLIPAIVVVGLLPFGAWLPRSLAAVFRTSDGLTRLAAATVLGVVFFFAFSQTKLPSYPFPAFGFGAIVIAHWLRRFWRSRRPERSDHWSFGFAAFLLCVIPIVVYLGLRQDRLLRELTPLWWQFCFTIPFGIFAIWQWFHRRYIRSLVSLGAGFFALQLFLFVSFLPRLNAFNQVTAALPLLREAPAFSALCRFAPAYVFALGAPIIRHDSGEELSEWLETAPSGSLVLTAARFADQIPAEKDLQPVFQRKDLFEYPTTIIYRYHANE